MFIHICICSETFPIYSLKNTILLAYVDYGVKLIRSYLESQIFDWFTTVTTAHQSSAFRATSPCALQWLRSWNLIVHFCSTPS